MARIEKDLTAEEFDKHVLEIVKKVLEAKPTLGAHHLSESLIAGVRATLHQEGIKAKDEEIDAALERLSAAEAI